MMQLYWDPVDSVSYGQKLEGRSVLLQMSVNDDEVTNMGTIMLAESADWPSLGGAVPGMPPVQAPTVGPVIASYDAELGDPDIGNQPSERTGAHREPRLWESAKLQTLHFLVDEPGQVQSYCQEAVCTPADG